MALLVTLGANLMCSFGVAPSALVVLPQARAMAESKPIASIADMIPMTNIPPFGMCMSMANPTVAAATAAALGILTPMPCTPLPAGPWKPGSPTVLVGGKPALTNACLGNCAYGGVITISTPGQFRTQAP